MGTMNSKIRNILEHLIPKLPNKGKTDVSRKFLATLFFISLFENMYVFQSGF